MRQNILNVERGFSPSALDFVIRRGQSLAIEKKVEIAAVAYFLAENFCLEFFFWHTGEPAGWGPTGSIFAFLQRGIAASTVQGGLCGSRYVHAKSWQALRQGIRDGTVGEWQITMRKIVVIIQRGSSNFCSIKTEREGVL
jgi:hypothetical protein